MKSNFSFLQNTFPVLANFGSLAEQYCYSDSNSCLMKLGMIGETIVNLIFNYDRIPFPYDNTAVARIDTLLREGLITRDLSDILHALRKTRNKVVHENYASVEEGKTLLQMAYSLCEWFMQTYGDWNYPRQPFLMPEPQAAPVDTAAEEGKEDKLIKEAEETAAASAKVDPNARKKQAQKAASQRVKSEAETRYMIDEQLRKVGWEADTENLRHSKGTRPQKGRCMAIAEWPTDSTVGDRGYADYALFIDMQMVATIEPRLSTRTFPLSSTTSARTIPATSAARIHSFKSAPGAITRFPLPLPPTAVPIWSNMKQNPVSGFLTCVSLITRRRPCTAGSVRQASKSFWRRTPLRAIKV